MRRALLGGLAALALALSPALAPAQIITGGGGGGGGGSAGARAIIGKLIGADMNSTADQAITLTPISGGKTVVLGIYAANCSISMTTAKGAFYAAPSKTTAMLGASAASVFSFLSTNSFWGGEGSNFSSAAGGWGGGFQNIQIAPFSSSRSIYLSLTTPQGAAGTCDFYVEGLALQ